MNKVVVVDNIINDAYNNAFLRIEELNYLEAEKLLDFVVRNSNRYDINMVDYGYVIIYSNTNKINEAITLCENIIKRNPLNKDLLLIIKEIYIQLKKDVMQNHMVNIKKYNIKHIVEYFETFKIILKDNDYLIELFADNDEIYFYKEYFNNYIEIENIDEKINIIEKNITKKIKTKIYKYILLENDLYSNKKSEYKNIYDFIKFDDNILFYLSLYLTNKISSILSSNYIDDEIKNHIVYHIYLLYSKGIIDEPILSLSQSIKHNIENEVSFSDFKSNHEQSLKNEIDDFYKKLYRGLYFSSDFINEVELYSQLIISFNFIKILNEKKIDFNYLIATLYLISEIEFNNEFDKEIFSVYQINKIEIIDKIKIINDFLKHI